MNTKSIERYNRYLAASPEEKLIIKAEMINEINRQRNKKDKDIFGEITAKESKYARKDTPTGLGCIYITDDLFSETQIIK